MRLAEQEGRICNVPVNPTLPVTIPFARFDEERCAKGLDCLREYQTEWDEKAHAFKVTPKQNCASHGADAWRYLSLAWRAPLRPAEPAPPRVIKGLPQITMQQFMDFEDPPLE